MEDVLRSDEFTIPDQKYALISVVSPTSNQKNDTCGVKIRGVFGTVEEAQKWAGKLQKLDPTFDIFLVELYKWLPIPPNKDMIENQEYQDQFLDTLIKTHQDEQVRAREMFEKHTMEMKSSTTAGSSTAAESSEEVTPTEILNSTEEHIDRKGKGIQT